MTDTRSVKEQLPEILAAHAKWLRLEAGGARANLADANLAGACLAGANLSDARTDETTVWGPRDIIPEEGAFTGWKKLAGDVVAMLGIPAEARRVSPVCGRKCRAEFVTVLALFDSSDALLPDDAVAYSEHDGTTAYRVGGTVYPDDFDDSILIECSHGIHFFVTRQEARNY